MSKKPLALIIMDGFGINKDSYGNAIAAAKKPNLDVRRRNARNQRPVAR